MTVSAQDTLAALQLLLRGSHLARAEDVPALIAAAGESLGAHRSVAYLIDYEQLVMVPFVGDTVRSDEAPLVVDTSLAGRSFRDVRQHIGAAADGSTLWSPIVDGTERMGVLQLQFEAGFDFDEETLQRCSDVAASVAELLVTRKAYGDAIEQARRLTPLTIPAEMQWQLLPPLTFVTHRAAIAGVLAPASEVAGDSFDYSANGTILHVAITDAMGHGLEAALLSAVAIASLRNARRSGFSLTDTVRVMDGQLASQFGGDKFVTATLGELDTTTGVWTWITCGHPPALVVRGGRVVKTLESVNTPPLGLHLLPRELDIGHERLEPGDRLLLYSDGVVEARDGKGEFFGVQRLVEFISKAAAADQPAAEALRRLNLSILEHQEGALQDDATTVMVEWLTDEPQKSTP